MRAKLVNENMAEQNGYYIDEIIEKLNVSLEYKKYARFRKLIGSTLVQLADELTHDIENVVASFIDVKSYDYNKKDKENYLDDSNDKFHMECTVGANQALLKFEYNDLYYRKLYGTSAIEPLYILLSKTN
jgi:hypothetical protein